MSSERIEGTRGAGDSLLECAGIVLTCREDDGALDHGSIQSGVAPDKSGLSEVNKCSAP